MDSLQQTTEALDQLQHQLKEMLDRIRALEEENKSLHVRQDALVAERAQLVHRNEEARERVEAMIERLKSLENAG
jgi:cell division protein ZapB